MASSDAVGNGGLSQADMVAQVERVRDEEVFVLSRHSPQSLVTTLWLVYMPTCTCGVPTAWLSDLIVVCLINATCNAPNEPWQHNMAQPCTRISKCSVNQLTTFCAMPQPAARVLNGVSLGDLKSYHITWMYCIYVWLI